MLFVCKLFIFIMFIFGFETVDMLDTMWDMVDILAMLDRLCMFGILGIGMLLLDTFSMLDMGMCGMAMLGMLAIDVLFRLLLRFAMAWLSMSFILQLVAKASSWLKG